MSTSCMRLISTSRSSGHVAVIGRSQDGFSFPGQLARSTTRWAITSQITRVANQWRSCPLMS